jgi:predicted metal-dependent enzyme (double-stranded beta helix superfamily)
MSDLENISLSELGDWLISKGRLADFLDVVGATTGLFNCSTEKVLTEGAYGNLYRRQMVVDRQGASVEGHKHNWDHVTYVIRGKVLMTVWKEDYNGKKHPGTSVERIYQAPAAILIRKNNFHKFTALTDDVILECVYAIRDSKTGEFSESFDGSMHPYT